MKTIKPQSILIKSNELLLKENDEWLYFSSPRHIVIAERLADVVPALREIEQLTEMQSHYAAGFLSYEAASAFGPEMKTHGVQSPRTEERLETEDHELADGFPYVWFGIYPKPRPILLPRPSEAREMLSWQPTVDRETYNAAIAQIKDHISEGRTYQVNYTMQLQTDFTGSTWDFFLHLGQYQNEHAAYVDTGRYVICSASPELFFQLNGKTITCRPMKGTAKRGRTTTEDREQAEWLRNSGKNRAENVMIVDMLRNDLGRIAETGSVRVPKLFTAERYPTLWQMTSTVTAETSASLTEIFSALFPCSSITGAPKVSTMKIISELEILPRKVYTGSIGYISPGRKAKFNVAIRTALIDRETYQATYGVGGGIVWDSTNADEYEEALLKARVLIEEAGEFSLLETMLWTPEEGFFLREKHLARMLDSANYFGISASREMLEGGLDQISYRFRSAMRVRLLLDQMGIVHLESRPHQPLETDRPLKIHIAKEPIDSDNIFLFHKTTQRDVYETARRAVPQHDDVLLYNQDGKLTEFTIGNLVVELDRKLFTPPISCGVLAGTFRAHLLESGKVTERIISIPQLRDCTKIFRVNSIRRWQRVQIKE
jgi:para-aminobenzoate synthetase/4-amino-4-deoxychorismate lyase